MCHEEYHAPAVYRGRRDIGFSRGKVVVRIKSSDGKRYYKITRFGKMAGALMCSCPAFLYGKHGLDSKGYCKHIRAFLGDW